LGGSLVTYLDGECAAFASRRRRHIFIHSNGRKGESLKRINTDKSEKSRGAVAVEFALVAPILLALLAGIVEFAHAYNLQISVTQAAREAARTMAITNDQAEAELAAANGAPGLATETFTYAFTPTACVADGTVNVEISYTSGTLTGIFGSGVTLVGVGAMRCGG
jgi:hypothetical protein